MSTPPTPDRPRRRVKAGYLVSGIVLLGLALLWLLDAAGLMVGISWTYLVPLLLIGAGVLGLVASVVGGLRGRREAAQTAVESDRAAESVTDAPAPDSVEDERDREHTSILPGSQRPDPTEPDPQATPSDIDMTAPLRREENR